MCAAYIHSSIIHATVGPAWGRFQEDSGSHAYQGLFVSCSLLPSSDILVQNTAQVSAFYKANAVAMDLETIVRAAPKRSRSPEHYNAAWDDLNRGSHSGSVTPSISISSTPTPADPYPGMGFNSFPFDTPFRMGTPLQPPSYSTYGSSYMSSSVAPPPHSPFFPTTMDSMRAQFGASIDPRTRPYVPIQPRGEQYLSLGGGRFNGDGTTPILGLPSKSNTFQPPNTSPATLRTTFRSDFPYSTLSPASFAPRSGGALARSIIPSSASSPDADAHMMRRAEVPMPSISSPSMAFDTAPAFVPPPQVWTHAPLQTTEDLAAYLEHRTKLAGQQRSDVL